jgi:hypothetical protein
MNHNVEHKNKYNLMMWVNMNHYDRYENQIRNDYL